MCVCMCVCVWCVCVRTCVCVCTCVQEKTRPLIVRYHGRELLFDWVGLQVQEAVFLNSEITPYPDYLRMKLQEGEVGWQACSGAQYRGRAAVGQHSI